MDFDWTPEQVELRAQARKVATEAVARYGRSNDSWINGYSKEFAHEMAALGSNSAVVDAHRSTG